MHEKHARNIRDCLYHFLNYVNYVTNGYEGAITIKNYYSYQFSLCSQLSVLISSVSEHVDTNVLHLIFLYSFKHAPSEIFALPDRIRFAFSSLAFLRNSITFLAAICTEQKQLAKTIYRFSVKMTYVCKHVLNVTL